MNKLKSKPVKQDAKLMDPAKPIPYLHVVYCGLIAAAVAFAVYANTLGHGYTVDDDTVMAKNRITKGGLDSLGTVFTTAYRAGFWDRDDNLYRPLSVAMFAMEWHFFPENPMPGHIMNVVLFSLTVFLLMLLMSQMLSGWPLMVPFSIALLFAVHPIHTEVVANIKSRDEILCLLFGVASLLMVSRYSLTQKTLPLLVAGLLFFLAMLSKENAITLLAVAPLYAYFTGKLRNKQIAIATIPFVLSVCLYLFIRWQVLGDTGKPEALQLVNNSLVGATDWLTRFASAVAILGRYLWLMVIPHPLSFDYSFNQIALSKIGSPQFLVSFAILVGLFVYAIKSLRNRELISFGILFLFITLSLVSNVFLLIESTMAERFMYMPSVGFLIMLCAFLSRVTKVNPKKEVVTFADHFRSNRLFASIVLVLVVAYSVKAVDRNADWKDNYTLLTQDVKTCPKSARIRYAYGSAILFEKALKEKDPVTKSNYLDQAVIHLSRGVEILPEYSEAWRHLGIAYKEQENYPAAVAALEKARSYKDFDAADMFATSGLCYGKVGRYPEALADLNRALVMNPDDPESNNNKGLYLFESGMIDSSIIYFDRAIALKSDFHQAYYNKGNTFASKGNYIEALRLYAKALEINPSSVDALMNSGNCYAVMNQLPQALEFFKRVEKLEPNNPKMLMNMGITYKNMGQESLANSYLSRTAAPKK
ncbi:MAG: tetratricopeptide repeat protein [Bacteroidota bacterium]